MVDSKTGLVLEPWLEYQPLKFRTIFCDLNTGLVWYSYVYCTIQDNLSSLSKYKSSNFLFQLEQAASFGTMKEKLGAEVKLFQIS
jgi:hypothetical protein